MTRDVLDPAEGYLELGMHDDALQYVESLNASERKQPKTSAIYLRALAAKDEHDSAVFFGNEMCQLYPTSASLRELTAASYLELGKPERAKEVLVTPPAPKDAACFYLLCLTEIRLGNAEAAKTALKRCLRKDRSYQKKALDDLRLDSLWMPED